MWYISSFLKQIIGPAYRSWCLIFTFDIAYRVLDLKEIDLYGIVSFAKMYMCMLMSSRKATMNFVFTIE